MIWADLADLVGCALVGRVVLAWLPAGSPGGHEPRELPATWAASHVLGFGIVSIVGRASSWIGMDFPIRIVAATTFALALARILTLPAAMVPRHEEWRPRAGFAAVALRIAAVALTVWMAMLGPLSAGTREPGRWIEIANVLALLALVDFGLERARAASWMRALAMCLLASVTALHQHAGGTPEDVMVALFIGAGASAAIAWIRRGDDRGLWLSALAFAFLSGVIRDGIPFAVAGLAWLVIATPAPSRRRIFAPVAVLLAAGCWLGWNAGATSDVLIVDLSTPSRVILASSFAACVLAGLVARMIDRRGYLEPSSGAATGAEDRMIARILFWGIVLALWYANWVPRPVVGRSHPLTRLDPLMPAVTLAIVLFGLSLKRFARKSISA